MNIVILHGTPKPNSQVSYSVAYIEFFMRNFTEHTFSVFKIGSDIKKLQKRETEYSELLDSVESADAVLFIMPVYSAMVPSGVKSFVELINTDNAAKKAFAGKWAATVTTSVNVLDRFVGQYIHAVCEDWHMHYVDSFFGTIVPVIDEQYKKNLYRFYFRFLAAAQERIPVQKTFNSNFVAVPKYSDSSTEFTPKKSGKKIALITDMEHAGENLSEMIVSFCNSALFEVEVIDLSEYNFSHCNGCIHCTQKLECAIKDGFQQLHKEKILTADALVIAGTIVDRYLSSEIKKFFDRGFYQNHIPYMKDKPVALIVSGPLRDNITIQESVISILELRGAACIGCVTDESEDNVHTAALIKQLAMNLSDCVEHNYTKPLSFYGVGSQRILRDFVYLTKYPFKGERPYFKKHGFKSFPQKRYKVRLLTWILIIKSKLSNSAEVLRSYQQKRAQIFKGLFF